MSLNVTADAAPAQAPSIAETATSARPQAWFDGALCDIDALQAGLTTHAMHYGSGVFEGIRSYATADGAAVFRLPEHMARMREGAALLHVAIDTAANVWPLVPPNHNNAQMLDADEATSLDIGASVAPATDPAAATSAKESSHALPV